MIATGASRLFKTAAAPISGGGIATKGSWAELTASTPFESYGVLVSTIRTGSGQNLYDIGMGAGGSEKVIVPNVLSWKHSTTFYLPVSIPAGVRLATRCQGGGTQRMDVTLFGGAFAQIFSPCSRVTDYGTDLTNCRGVFLTGAGFNTKTAYFEITASTTYPIRYMVVFHQQVEADSVARFDIAIGAAGSEKIILPDILYNGFSGIGGLFGQPGVSCWPIYIPQGTRLAVRYQISDPFFSLRDDFTVSCLGVG